MANKKFTAVVSKWAQKNDARLLAVFQTATQDIKNEMVVSKGEGGLMPVVTGNLRRSIMASTEEMPSIKEGPFFNPDSQIALVILNAKLGDKIYLGFQAAYAARMEYGFVGQDSLGRQYNQKGNGFVRAAMQRWPQIVAAAARRIKQKVEGT